MSSGLLRKYIDLFEQDKPFKVDVVDGPNIVFIGDSIAFGLSGKMMNGTRADAAVGLTSNAIANRVARNKNVQNALYAVVSAGTNDFANGKGDAAALESNLAAIRSSLKAVVYIWLGPYNSEANAVVKKFASSRGADMFLDLNKYPADSLGIHPRDYVSVINDLLRMGISRGRDSQDTARDSLADKVFNTTPGAAPKDTPSAEIEKTQPPSDISQYKGKVKQVQQDFKTKFSRDLPITSQERTRAEQQDLYDRWRRGEKGIYTPVNPATQPGRSIFHNTAIDISPALSREEETWMNQQGWVRTMPTQDPVHYEYQGKWDEPTATPSPSVTPAPGADKNNKDTPVSPQIQPDLDRLGKILRKKVKEDRVDQLTPIEQMQFWQSVLEADAPARQEPTFNPDAFDPSAELADKYKQALDTPAASRPKIVKDGAGYALIAPNGQRFGGFPEIKDIKDWMAKPENYKMAMGNAPTNWIGGTPGSELGAPVKRDLNLKPLSSFNKFKQAGSFPKAKAMGKGAAALAALGAGANYAYNTFRDQDLSDYAPEDQAYIKEMLPVIKGYYNNVDKFQSELNRDQQLQVIDYVNTLKKLPALKSEFPANSKWDIYIKTIN